MIRSTDDMYSLRKNNKLLTPSSKKRRRPGDPTLSTLERAVLRLWAVQLDNLLTNMPDDLSSTIGQQSANNNHCDNEARDPVVFVVVEAVNNNKEVICKATPTDIIENTPIESI
jgi:hypothetical protein